MVTKKRLKEKNILKSTNKVLSTKRLLKKKNINASSKNNNIFIKNKSFKKNIGGVYSEDYADPSSGTSSYSSEKSHQQKPRDVGGPGGEGPGGEGPGVEVPAAENPAPAVNLVSEVNESDENKRGTNINAVGENTNQVNNDTNSSELETKVQEIQQYLGMQDSTSCQNVTIPAETDWPDSGKNAKNIQAPQTPDQDNLMSFSKLLKYVIPRNEKSSFEFHVNPESTKSESAGYEWVPNAEQNNGQVASNKNLLMQRLFLLSAIPLNINEKQLFEQLITSYKKEGYFGDEFRDVMGIKAMSDYNS